MNYALQRQSDHDITANQEVIIPDSRGINLFHADPYMDDLLKAYLPKAIYEHVVTHFHELGASAGAELDEAAMVADKNPPVLSTRNRSGEVQYTVHKHPAYISLEKAAYEKYGLAAMSHRAGVLGWSEPLPPAVK